MRLLAPWALILLVVCGRAGAPAVQAQELSQVGRWLQGYLRLDTSNPPGSEHLAAAYLQRILRSAGIGSELVVTPEGRTNLVARLRAREGVDGPALLLLHHMDVVAAGEGWQRPPFGGEVAQGRLWGRGAVDAKSLGVAQLAAVVALAKSGRAPRRDVIFLAVADEERGGGQGTAFLLEHHPELVAGVQAVLNEGGANRQVNGRLLWWGVEVAQKRPLWLRLTSAGRGGHAAGYHPGSAMHRMVSALDRILERPPTWRVTPAARRYLATLAPLHNEHVGPIFAEIDRHIGPDGPRAALLPGMANLFLDTVQVTMIEGAPQINVVPARVTAHVDVRLLPDSDAEAFLASLREAVGPDIAVEVLVSSPEAPSSPEDGPVYELLRQELGPAPVVPFFSPGFTDSRFFRGRGIPAYGFSPFALEPQELLGIHGVDESIPLAELEAGARRMERVVAAWALGEP